MFLSFTKAVLAQQVASNISSKATSNSSNNTNNDTSTKQPFAYYYELLADHYEKDSASAAQTLLICANLVSNTHFPCIFACIFYRWVRMLHLQLTLLKSHIFTILQLYHFYLNYLLLFLFLLLLLL